MNETRKCPLCGAEIPANARHCTQCGAALYEEPEVPAETAEEPVGPETAPEAAAPVFDHAPAAPDPVPLFPDPEPLPASAFSADGPKPEPVPPLQAAAPGYPEPDRKPEPAPGYTAPAYNPPAYASAAYTAPAYNPPPAAPAAPAGEQAPGRKSKYAPMTSWGMALQLFLTAIPGIGLILMILWSCGACRKIVRRNLARATLILTVIGLIALIVLLILGWFFCRDAITHIFELVVPGYTIQWN